MTTMTLEVAEVILSWGAGPTGVAPDDWYAALAVLLAARSPA